MKVFDFTNGTKGELLGHIKLTDYAGGWLVEKAGSTFKVTLSGTYGGKDVHIDPKDFGADAVCFCTGEFFHQWHDGHPEAESHWCWNVIGTTDWNRSACKSGILKATKQA